MGCLFIFTSQSCQLSLDHSSQAVCPSSNKKHTGFTVTPKVQEQSSEPRTSPLVQSKSRIRGTSVRVAMKQSQLSFQKALQSRPSLMNNDADEVMADVSANGSSRYRRSPSPRGSPREEQRNSPQLKGFVKDCPMKPATPNRTKSTTTVTVLVLGKKHAKAQYINKRVVRLNKHNKCSKFLGLIFLFSTLRLR